MGTVLKICKLLIYNPIYIWLDFVFYSIKVYSKNHTIKMGFLSKIINSNFGKYVVIHERTKIINSSIDSFTYVGANSIVLHSTVGKFCCISHNVQIGTGKHPAERFVSSHPIFYSLQKQSQKTFTDKQYFNEYDPVVIGNDVWIGTNVVIVDGIVIGNGAIIAAGSVVTKNVQPYEIVGGVPAKVIRKRFSEEKIEYLSKSLWWDRDEEWLKENFKSFHDVEQFMKL